MIYEFTFHRNLELISYAMLLTIIYGWLVFHGQFAQKKRKIQEIFAGIEKLMPSSSHQCRRIYGSYPEVVLMQNNRGQGQYPFVSRHL